MSLTWPGEGPAFDPPRPRGFGYILAGLRGGALLSLLLLGLALMGLLRLIERPLCHPRRPVTPSLTVAVCRAALAILGLRVARVGRPMGRPGALVANHSSWLDIFALNSGGRVVFVSKAEVADWGGIGLLARATGTLFIRREARGETGAQVAAIGERLRAGERLVLFPEGTSTDGRRVLPFKAPLFAGLLATGLPENVAVQPVTLSWTAPAGEDPRFYGWWGGAAFGPSALAILAATRPGAVRVTYHPPIPIVGRDRKALAREAEALVRSAL